MTGAGGLLAAEVLAPPEVMKKRLATQVNALWGAIRQRSIFLPAVFVFLWQVGILQKRHKGVQNTLQPSPMLTNNLGCILQQITREQCVHVSFLGLLHVNLGGWMASPWGCTFARVTYCCMLYREVTLLVAQLLPTSSICCKASHPLARRTRCNDRELCSGCSKPS